MSDSTFEEGPAGLSPVIGIAGAFLVALAGLVVSTFGRYQFSFAAYVLVLVLGVALIALYRYSSMKRTLSTSGYVVSRAQRRLALLPVILIFVSCAANAFVWASEVAKR